MSMSSKRPLRAQSFQHAPSPNVQHFSRSYPSFLSVRESLQLQLTWAWRGFLDAFHWNLVVSAVSSDSEIRTNLYKSLLLNSLSLMSIHAFDLLLLPLVRNQQKWLHRNFGWLYQGLWLFPVVGLSFYLNSSWCSIIANRTYTLQRGRRATTPQPVTYTGMLTAIATSAYRIVMVFTSFVLSLALGNVPYIGSFVRFVFLCWVDSYYCFEYVWIARGLSLSRRIRHLEERWAYYLAFGLPSATLCTWGSGLANAAVFALVFPVYIIMAVHAHPLPIDPYIPSKPNENEIIRHPSPFVPIRLPIFAVVMWLNDLIIGVLSFGGGKSSRGFTSGRNRTPSDPTENVEEGGLELRNMTRLSKTSGQAVDRVRIGRRKAD